METWRRPPVIGIAGSVLFVVVLAVPYVIVGTGPGSGVSTYYGTGSLNPLVGGFFALVASIVFGAGRGERTDPVLAAGITLVLGLAIVTLAALWAVTVPIDVVVGLSTNTLLEHHRWVLVAVAVLVPAGSLWWTRTLGLL